MKLSTITRILKEDLARYGDLPGWVDVFLSPINQFIDQVASALRNNLTFKDNFLCKVVTQKVVSGEEYPINPGTNVRVEGILPVHTGRMLISDWGWYTKDDGMIAIKVSFSNYVNGTAAGAGTEATMVFVILLG